MRYNLNLARRPFINTTLPALLAGALVLVILLFTAINITVLLSTTRDVGDYQRRIVAALQSRDEMQSNINRITQFLRRENIRQLTGRVKFANDLIKERKLNWSQLFNRLEELTPTQVRMLRISPRIRGEKIILDLDVDEGRPGAVLSYTSTLRRSPFFPEVLLMNESPSSSGPGQKWQLEVSYRNE